MTGMVLRLAGPLQSWGERSPFPAERDTAPFPTRSGMIGMFAAAEGLSRDQDLSRYEPLEFTVRVDRPGVPLVDYHTVGGGEPDEFTAATSGGKHKGAAVITRRTYLADAVFVVGVRGPDRDIDRIAGALHQPYWNPYLGRRSCPPDEPFVLRARVEDPDVELCTHVPLSPPAGPDLRYDRETEGVAVQVSFYWETYRLGTPPDSATRLSVADRPVSFAPHGRSHGRRRLLQTVEELPAELCVPQHALQERLVSYARGEDLADVAAEESA
jgi:CRISPR system Cascade subunit CasD